MRQTCFWQMFLLSIKSIRPIQRIVIQVRNNIRKINPDAVVIEAASPLFLDDPAAILGKRVLVIEDGPTLTHGEMAYGAGWVAARRFGAKEIVDPRPYAVRSIISTYNKYPDYWTNFAGHGIWG